MTAHPTGEPLLELVRVMDRLRSPGGCPWDARQTHQSLVEYLIEESYEAVEAIELNDRVALREELGDVLLQVVFHARIAQEAHTEPFSIDDVAAGIVAKLIARHPHVFGNELVEGAEGEAPADHLESRWQQMKSVEKGRTSVTEGIPEAMPALLLAAKLLRRAEHGGVEAEVATEAARAAAERALVAVGDEGVGDLLLALVDGARARGIDSEAALRAALRQHRSVVLAAEAAQAAQAAEAAGP